MISADNLWIELDRLLGAPATAAPWANQHVNSPRNSTSSALSAIRHELRGHTIRLDL
jgi:hypothetical protein